MKTSYKSTTLDYSVLQLVMDMYVQLFRSPTTANGTLIDHVYCSNAHGNAIDKVQDMCYSNHDTVYSSLPL